MIESEKLLEQKLRNTIAQHGGWAIKLLSTHIKGLPDRLCLFPGGKICFVELKTTGEKPTKIQLKRHDRIKEIGFEVYVVSSTKDIKQLINKYPNLC